MSVRQESNDVLVLRDEIGQSKRSTRRLPDQGHTYGKPCPRDKHGVNVCKPFEIDSPSPNFSDV